MSAASVIVGLSGGVDSAVAALLLKRAGREPAGLFMQNWDEDEPGECTADADRRDAVAVCAALGLPFHARNFAAEYREQVFAHFLAEYRAGRTPNPDVLCNREIKFRRFLDEARALGAERIATGHYARIDRVAGRWRLKRARDANKDQSYFLHALGQEQLAASEFPIGDLAKDAVRRFAREAGIGVHAKKDSTGICFIGERDFRKFLARWLPARRGEIRSPEGEVIGSHDGTFYYTLGQRDGLGIGGRRGGSGAPWYVVGKDVAANILYAAQGDVGRWLDARRLVARDVNWVAGIAPGACFETSARIRYRQPDQACTVEVGDDGCLVTFARQQRAVTPGQSVVFYDGDVCLGGGVITRSDAAFGGWSG
jgi:tRNA-specific 2-thiouridylase